MPAPSFGFGLGRLRRPNLTNALGRHGRDKKPEMGHAGAARWFYDAGPQTVWVNERPPAFNASDHGCCELFIH